MVETFGTEKMPRAKIAELVAEHFDLRPGAFREELRLHRPIYQKTAAYGHFGRDEPDFTWERTDRGRRLREAAGLERARPRPRSTRAAPGREAARAPASSPRPSAPPRASGLVDHVDDVRRVGDAGEDEVVVVARGGVEVDVADLQHPLEHATACS